MKLSENRLGIEWLRQFDPREVHLARLVLDSLRLISFKEFEESMSRAIEGLLAKTDGYVGVFPIDKKLLDPESKPGSEGRLGHAVTNLERQFPDRILVSPDQQTMLEKKVNHIFLVDDFVASGQRVKEYWKAWASKTYKSWLSYHACELWLVGYAIHESGLRNICDHISYVDEDHLCFDIVLSDASKYWPQKLIEFCEESATRLANAYFPLGFDNMMCPLVFQHGCPDNCPSVLWENGSNFRALFPSRGIPVETYPCFEGSNDSGRKAELLWDAGQYKLALALVDDFASGKRSSDYVDLIMVLGLLLTGRSIKTLPAFLTLNESRVIEVVELATELGLVKDSRVTPFGRDIVDRSKRTFFASKSPVKYKDESNYFPMQFRKSLCGAQRKSRNEPV